MMPQRASVTDLFDEHELWLMTVYGVAADALIDKVTGGIYKPITPHSGPTIAEILEQYKLTALAALKDPPGPPPTFEEFAAAKWKMLKDKFMKGEVALPKIDPANHPTCDGE